MWEIALISRKIYTAGTNFTRPPVDGRNKSQLWMLITSGQLSYNDVEHTSCRYILRVFGLTGDETRVAWTPPSCIFTTPAPTTTLVKCLKNYRDLGNSKYLFRKYCFKKCRTKPSELSANPAWTKLSDHRSQTSVPMLQSTTCTTSWRRTTNWERRLRSRTNFDQVEKMFKARVWTRSTPRSGSRSSKLFPTISLVVLRSWWLNGTRGGWMNLLGENRIET